MAQCPPKPQGVSRSKSIKWLHHHRTQKKTKSNFQSKLSSPFLTWLRRDDLLLLKFMTKSKKGKYLTTSTLRSRRAESTSSVVSMDLFECRMHLIASCTTIPQNMKNFCNHTVICKLHYLI
jgi:hypothetical protein